MEGVSIEVQCQLNHLKIVASVPNHLSRGDYYHGLFGTPDGDKTNDLQSENGAPPYDSVSATPSDVYTWGQSCKNTCLCQFK